MFDRGYTGHQHLDDFNLINMLVYRSFSEGLGGRLYDPVLARFLSPDPFVQAPGNGQNFNRYTYAFNNPLKYTDPDGEWVHLAIGAAIGGIINWATHGAQFNAQGLGYFGVGALAGAVAAGVGAGIGSVFMGGSFGAGFLVSYFKYSCIIWQEIPKSKSQIPNKLQAPNPKITNIVNYSCFGHLVLGIWCLFGAWDLGFLVYPG